MNDRHQRILEQIFQEVVTLPAEKRPAFLAENCSDPELRAELQSLLPCATGSTLDGIANAIGEMASV